ncbi:MAG: META domain-containing protein [Bacteroidales bacterium]|jgi:heat shock protein HslJ|nr:META domain-containing protein [Bacteroidales bacterium]
MIKKLAYLFLLLALVGLSSCKSKQRIAQTASQADIRLHDIWVLDEIDNQKLDRDSFSRGLPQLEIFVEEKRIGGHDGCNEIRGGLETSGDLIRFGSLASAKIKCPKMQATDSFRNLLEQKEYHFNIKSNRLIFYSGNETALIFKKID